MKEKEQPSKQKYAQSWQQIRQVQTASVMLSECLYN